jgi:hypothetical protein
MSTANIFRKLAKEYEINGVKVMISPLKVGTLLRVQGLSKAISEAIAKLRNIIVNDYEQIKNSKPNPTEQDKEAIEYYEKTTHKAPEISAISLVIQNKQEGIRALFDCLFQNDLLETILRTSVDAFKDVPKGELLNEDSEFAIDIPTALEAFIAIVEVNAGGFQELGKFSHLLAKLQGVAKAEK